jgi:hypothetical protein
MTPEQHTTAILDAHPEAKQIPSLDRAISDALRAAVADERAACIEIAEELQETETTNKREHSLEVHGALFAKDATATNIANRIRARGDENGRSENRGQVAELVSELNSLLNQWKGGSFDAAVVQPQVVKATAGLTLLLAGSLGHGKNRTDDSSGV